MMNLFKKSSVFLLASALFTSTTLFAQEVAPVAAPTTPTTSPNVPVVNQQLIDYYNQAKAAGMSDFDIERAAIQRGVPKNQIEALKNRSMQNGDNGSSNREVKEQDLEREQNDVGEIDEWEFSDDDDEYWRIGIRSSENRAGRIFGSSFFSKASPSFEPNLRIPTPVNYILGPEDELNVDIHGVSVDNLKLKISPEGTVQIYNRPPLFLSGLTIEAARTKIINELRHFYGGIGKGDGSVSLTLGNIRSIKVMVTGEVARPGTYTVSSLATVFNVLYQSGGPNMNGSYRNISVIRGNKEIRKIDLYKFLVDGSLEDNLDLRDQDIIIIKPYQSRIYLTGQIKRPGIYELLPRESLADLITYASGFRPEAMTNSIQFRRNNGILYEIGIAEESEYSMFIPKNGDRFMVSRVLDIIPNYIEINGAVIKPGMYPYTEGTNTVKKLINKSLGLSPKAYLERIIIERIGYDYNKNITLDLSAIMKDSTADYALQLGDKLIIKSIDDFVNAGVIEVKGEVKNPGVQSYYEGLKLTDLLFKAGGFTDAGVGYKIEISRRVKSDTADLAQNQNIRIFELNHDEDFRYSPDLKDIILERYDNVTVRRAPRFQAQKFAKIVGEVMYPGEYAIKSSDERISDLLKRVGGVKPEANLAAARFTRNGELVSVELKDILKNENSKGNLYLKDGDVLTIPTIDQLVYIKGHVQNPSVISYDNQLKYSDYVEQAGGMKENALKKKVYITYPNGRTYLAKKNDTIVPGATIVVPAKEVKVAEPLSRAERIAILSLLVTTSLAIIRIFN